MKKTAEAQPFPPCVVCDNGWFTIVRLRDVEERPLWAHERQHLTEKEREALPEGATNHDLIRLRQPNRPAPPKYDHRESAACLCPAGRAKLRAIYGVIGMERILQQNEIDALWPHGVPREETLSSALEAAGVPPLCWSWTLESYKGRFGNDRQTRALLKSAKDWLASPPSQRTDLLIFGPNGTGKTGLAIGLLIEIVEKNERILYEDARRLFMGWRETFREDASMSEEAYLARWESVPTLIIDETQEGSDKSRPVLQLLVDRRQKMRRPTVLIMNVPEDQSDVSMAQPFLAQALGPALFDRLRERAQFWALFGSSRRKALVLPFKAPESTRGEDER